MQHMRMSFAVRITWQMRPEFLRPPAEKPIIYIQVLQVWSRQKKPFQFQVLLAPGKYVILQTVA